MKKRIRNGFNLIVFFLVLFLLVSCGNNSGGTASLIHDGLAESEISDIPISINLAHTEDEYLKQFNPVEYRITKESDKDITIDINSDYYKKYMSGRRFLVPKDAVLSTEILEYLTLNMDVVNNTDNKLDISGLEICVDESEPDSEPFVYIRTSEDMSNSISFINGSWFNWQGFTFSYRILKRGESFDGNYNKRKHISFFDNYITIDLLPDMKELGYDFDGLLQRGLISCNYQEDGRYHVFYEGESSSMRNVFAPFEVKKVDEYNSEGYATLYGTIQFDNSDVKIDFIAKVSLFTDGLGAVSYENDRFDVQLKSSGTNYVLKYPYTTVIEPHGAEMVKLVVSAKQSSHHNFYIRLRNGNDLNIRTKDIHFHHFFPKNCDKWW